VKNPKDVSEGFSMGLTKRGILRVGLGAKLRDIVGGKLGRGTWVSRGGVKEGGGQTRDRAFS